MQLYDQLGPRIVVEVDPDHGVAVDHLLHHLAGVGEPVAADELERLVAGPVEIAVEAAQDDPVALALREVEDRVGVARLAVCCRPEDEPVRIGPADQDVAAFAGMQPIMSRTTVEKVVAATPMQPFVVRQA